VFEDQFSTHSSCVWRSSFVPTFFGSGDHFI